MLACSLQSYRYTYYSNRDDDKGEHDGYCVVSHHLQPKCGSEGFATNGTTFDWLGWCIMVDDPSGARSVDVTCT